MNNASTTLLLGLLVTLTTTTAAQPQPGDIGLFADDAFTRTTLRVEPGATYELRLAAFDVEAGIARIYLGLGDFASHPAFSSATIEWEPPFSPLLEICCPIGYIATASPCVGGEGPTVIARLRFTVADEIADDTAICITPPPVSTFGLVPQFRGCDGVTRAFGTALNGEDRYLDGCVILNPTQQAPVASETATWSAVKTRF